MSILKQQGLMIDLIEAHIPENMCLGALSFCGGTACSNFAIFDDNSGIDESAWDGEGGESTMIFNANRAFWHVFKAYISKLDSPISSAGVFLDAAATMIAWGFESPSVVFSSIRDLFAITPEKKLFTTAKEAAFNEYVIKFSNPLFRFTHKILEQTEPAFGFTYEAFTSDFENITFEEFLDGWKHLVVPGNALFCLMINDINQVQVDMDNMELPISDSEVVAMPTKLAVPLDRTMDIALTGTSIFSLGALCFGPMVSFSPAEKKIFLEVMNQHLFGGTGSVSVDLHDASLIFTDRAEENLLDSRVWRLDEEAFMKCTDAVAVRMADAFHRHPELFIAEQARDSQQGFSDVSIMQIVRQITYETFEKRFAGAFDQARQIRISQVCVDKVIP